MIHIQAKETIILKNVILPYNTNHEVWSIYDVQLCCEMNDSSNEP
jgi:hypothetical protein